MPRIRLTLAYEGTDFCGWQIQNGQPTIQGCIENALATLCGVPTRIYGSGRTDSGVHAMAQVAHMDIPDTRTHIPWQKALNAILPPSIRIIDVQTVGADFHARYASVSKTYSYTLWTNADFVLPQRRRFVWNTGPLDIPAMQEAADYIIGTHDFKSFQNLGTDVQSTVRTITAITHKQGITRYEVVWTLSATGFLKQMVRNIIGLLYKVGKGKIQPKETAVILEARDRKLAPATAPAQGLCMEYVEYEKK
ncbi:MAG: tRNA pseudouridine(38-40) synthase TruA [Desulfoplanes sp.]